MSTPRILLVGNRTPEHVGAQLEAAAADLRLPVRFVNMQDAFDERRWRQRFNWRFRGRRPNRLEEFSETVVTATREFQPSCLISTGFAPVVSTALRAIGEQGVTRINFLTDDPWNRAQWSPWFVKALTLYDWVFSTRKANVADLRNLGGMEVRYLPFGYAPHLYFKEEPQEPVEADVLFAGGADRDRVPYIDALHKAGFAVALYGGYWERFPETARLVRGIIPASALRQAIVSAKVTLCLVRRANRDGHCMRTFEVPAVGGCMLTEDTAEHREIFGLEGEAVVYFRDTAEMVGKARWLLEHPQERRRLADAAHRLIVQGKNTYQDRLTTMLETVGMFATAAG
jgi:spore maturation protein CgeB